MSLSLNLQNSHTPVSIEFGTMYSTINMQEVNPCNSLKKCIVFPMCVCVTPHCCLAAAQDHGRGRGEFPLIPGGGNHGSRPGECPAQELLQGRQ